MTIKEILRESYYYFFPHIQTIRTRPWFSANGDKTYRLNYPGLNSNSIVIDLGGYEGQWASDIYSKYNSTVYVFEPYKAYAEAITARFEKNEKIKVYPVGLGKSDSTELLNISEDGSSIFTGQKNADTTEIKIEEIGGFLKAHQIDKIDLMKINIEGGEYDLLEHLIATKAVTKITDIQVQFHDFVPDAEKRMKAIQKGLSETHELTYQFEFVWENWKLKSKS